MGRPLVAALAASLLIVTPGALPAVPPKTAASNAVRIDKVRIDAALANMVASGRAAGVEALIWQDGREVYYGKSGYADREAKAPMMRDTQVELFSMTKPVTGTALMQLWEQGKFRLDDPLAKYLPEFANMQVMDKNGAVRPASRPILIRDILRHTAGLSYGTGMGQEPADVAFSKADPLGLDHDLTEMGARLGKLPLLFDPGTEWRYSVAADVQALLVEKLSGQPFEQYVRQHILDPLGMRETGWTKTQAQLAHFAPLYIRHPEGGPITRQDDATTRRTNFEPRKLTPGGYGLVAPIDDYMRFARMLQGQGSLDGVRILNAETVKLMSTDQLDPAITERSWLRGKGNMGFGFDFAVRVGPPENAQEARGAVGEFYWDGAASTLFWVDPVNKLTVVFFVQTRPNDQTLHRDLRRAIYGDDYLGPAQVRQ
jgi:CubicO group peptidase (beta-lactamase class C family)